mmetsp:Transcript_95193/g.245980  ORF Transcript_95193/g.245980 Transcript_95193/m.245980 type:complete len:279 (-) Transcript_95193:395-1231(-)
MLQMPVGIISVSKSSWVNFSKASRNTSRVDSAITSPMDRTGGDCRFAPFIHALTFPCPMAVQTSPRRKHRKPYQGSNRPNISKETHAAVVVKRIMVVAVEAATSGLTPISSISGPFTMPPPTPKRPAKTPARVQTSGYRIVVLLSHRSSEPSNFWPASTFCRLSAMSILRKTVPKKRTQGTAAKESSQKPEEPHSTPMIDPCPLPLRTVSTMQPPKQTVSSPILPQGVACCTRGACSPPISVCDSSRPPSSSLHTWSSSWLNWSWTASGPLLSSSDSR